MTEDLDTADLERTRKVYETIKKCPGLESRDLQAWTKLNMGGLRASLTYLEKEDLIHQKDDGTYHRFFVKDGLSEDEKKILLFLRQYQIREMILFLMRHPGSTVGDVAKNIHISNGSMAWHAKKLSVAGIIKVGRLGWPPVTRLELVRPGLIKKLLITYKESFLDRLVNKFIDSWT